MFQVENFVQSNKVCSFELKYRLNGKDYKIPYAEVSTEQARKEFIKTAFQYLQFQLDDLYVEVQNLRPYYFNNASIPYCGNDNVWPKSYWDFLTLRKELEKAKSMISLFCYKILNINLNGLIPVLHFENREQIRELVKSINKLASEIINTLKKISNETDPINS